MTINIILRQFIAGTILFTGFTGVFAHAQNQQASQGQQPNFTQTWQQATQETAYGKVQYGVLSVKDANGKTEKYALTVAQNAQAKKTQEDLANQKRFQSFIETQKYIAEMQRRQVLSKTAGQTLKDATLRFPIETGTFFIAIGSIVAAEMVWNYGGDPLAMQRHFDSLQDPATHLSFYSFIAANALTNNALQKYGYRKLDEIQRQKLFRRLPYIGMTAGSIASHLTGDIYGYLKSCAVELMSHTTPSEKPDEVLYTACEEAQRQWTAEKKFDQYMPALISLFASQKLSELTMHALMNSSQKVNTLALTHLSFDISKSIGGKILVGGMRFLGNPILFMGLDMLITNPIATRGWNSVSDDIALKSLSQSLPGNISECDPSTDSSKATCDELQKKLVSWRDRNKNWRNTLNAEFETALYSWTELMNRIDRQTIFTQSVYATLINKYKEEIAEQQACSLDEKSNQCRTARNKNSSIVLSKPQPLYGVLVDTKSLDSEKELSPAEVLKRSNDTYLDFYRQNEAGQISHLKKVAAAFEKFISENNKILQSQEDKVLISQILQSLKSDDTQNISKGLIKLNAVLLDYKKLYTENRDLWTALKHMQVVIGKPSPITTSYTAFPYIFSINSDNAAGAVISHFPLSNHRYPYVFPTSAHYLIHEMLCANEKAEIGSLSGFKTVDQSLVPPRLVQVDVKSLHNYCRPMLLANQTDYAKRMMRPFIFPQGEMFALEFLTKNINPAALDFEKWWLEKTEPTLAEFENAALSEWTKIYRNLIAGFNDNAYAQNREQRKSLGENIKGFLSDQSTQSKNVFEIINQELAIYTQALAVLKNKNTDAAMKKLNDAITTTMTSIKYVSATPEKTKDLKSDLETALTELKKSLQPQTQNERTKTMIKTVIYGLDSVYEDMTKYLLAGYTIDQNKLQDIKDLVAQQKKLQQSSGQQKGTSGLFGGKK